MTHVDKYISVAGAFCIIHIITITTLYDLIVVFAVVLLLKYNYYTPWP